LLTGIEVDPSNPNYLSLDGVLFNKAQTTLISHPTNRQGAYVIPATVQHIGYYAFASCFGLTSVTIPVGVTSVGDYAFAFCNALTSVDLPSQLTSIGERAFFGCSLLTQLTIPDGVVTIGDRAFGGCHSLLTIAVGANNPNYSSIDGVLYNKNHKTLVAYPGGKDGPFTIPSGVTDLAPGAFAMHQKLTSIFLPSSLTRVGSGWFARCAVLQSVVIEEGIVAIESGAFSFCSSLQSVTIPGSVTSIGNAAFMESGALISVVFEGDAPMMGTNVFSGAADGFSVFFNTGAVGFTAPTWHGYASVAISGVNDFNNDGRPDILLQAPGLAVGVRPWMVSATTWVGRWSYLQAASGYNCWLSPQ
jgi:hypothetical protein